MSNCKIEMGMGLMEPQNKLSVPEIHFKWCACAAFENIKFQNKPALFWNKTVTFQNSLVSEKDLQPQTAENELWFIEFNLSLEHLSQISQMSGAGV